MNKMDLLFTNVSLATMVGGYGEQPDAALAVKDGRIAWIGPRAQAPQATREHDCGGAWMTPGLVDCHTHIVHAGNRSNEWEARLNGATYEDIARQGGGIMSTVRATREADVDALVAASLPRVEAMLREGVTTLEIKSGYGLELESEARMLQAARRIGELLPVRVATTFLGAHALPPEFAGRADDYVTEVCERMLPRLAEQGLVDAVDAFCERIGFAQCGPCARIAERDRHAGSRQAGRPGLCDRIQSLQGSLQGRRPALLRPGWTISVHPASHSPFLRMLA